MDRIHRYHYDKNKVLQTERIYSSDSIMSEISYSTNALGQIVEKQEKHSYIYLFSKTLYYYNNKCSLSELEIVSKDSALVMKEIFSYDEFENIDYIYFYPPNEDVMFRYEFEYYK
jgi:hypothetical protein